MAITEGNDKISIPIPGAKRGERNTQQVDAPTPTSNSDEPEYKLTNSGDPAIDGTTTDNPDDTDGLHWEQARRQGQGQANGFKPQPMASRMFAPRGFPVPPLPTLRATYQRNGSEFMPIDAAAYEILAADIEEFFADYMSQLHSLKKSKVPANDETTIRKFRFASLIVRELREYVLNQTKAGCVHDGEPDPFFAPHKVPHLLPVTDENMGECTAIPLRNYYHRLMLNFPHLQMIPPQYLGVVDGFINVGVKDNKHYIIIPEVYVLFSFVGIEFDRMQDTQ